MTVTSDGGGDEGVVCFVEDSSSCDSWYRMAVGFCFFVPAFLICKIEEREAVVNLLVAS